MSKRIAILFLVCLFVSSALSQTENYALPVKWERYKVSRHDVSVLLPRLPTMISKSEACSGRETLEYAVYSDQIIYGLTITSKRKNPDFCSRVKGAKEFDDQSFKERLNEIKVNSPKATESIFEQNKLDVIKILGDSKHYWLVDDAKAERWFEIWLIGGSEEKNEVKNFIKSIEINTKSEGVEIGNGAERTFGDEFVKKYETEAVEKTPLEIALKPQPRYTDKARENEVTGAVTLKVTFLSNGAIGSIIPISGLSFGLTEQAILAAKRIVFIPPKYKGTCYSVTKTITYKFTIY